VVVPLEQIDEYSRLFYRGDRALGPVLTVLGGCFSAQSTRSSRFSRSIRLLRWRLAFAVPDEFTSLEATFSAGVLGVRRTAIGDWRDRDLGNGARQYGGLFPWADHLQLDGRKKEAEKQGWKIRPGNMWSLRRR
jgi:hypothetical protein